ncbi:MAG: hypothetical protein E6K70_00165 [Planctomycetota bacterium]|nr:MAG: hypothetical protein E6K70_00165 [Planctomycetota bacterium]
MAVLSCYQCRGAVADNAAACPHCGAPLARDVRVGSPAPIGVCYRCGELAFAPCRDCGRFHCPQHGGKDLLGHPACNHCRKRRIILLLVVFPLLLALFLIGFIVVRYIFQPPRRIIERAAPPATAAVFAPGRKNGPKVRG